MWFSDLPKDSTWASLWFDYILCGACCGIRRVDKSCPGCGAGPLSDQSMEMELGDGRRVILHPAFAGAEGRYEDYVYLQMLQREWERPAPAFERFAHFAEHEQPSARAALVLLFWSYFETRLERLIRGGLRSLPESVREDLLERYSSVGARLYRLYRIAFGCTYFEDISALGYERVAKLLVELHKRRNEFAHGRPQAIDDSSVCGLVEVLKDEHESWIAAFNLRATRRAAEFARQGGAMAD